MKMAIMHPQNLNNYDPTPSEKIFFTELERQLDDKFHVFYSVKWYSTTKKGNRINSETDFLIFSSDLGYLTIEVKGGQSIEVNDRKWTLHYTDENGNAVSQDLGKGPYDQADRSMYYFYDYYKKETCSKFQGSYGMAVAFPFFNLDKELENDAPKELTIQLSDMNNLEKRINEIFHYWNKQNHGKFLSNSQASKFIGLVNKRIALSVAAGALIPITERKLETINIVQDTTISLISNYKRTRIVGGAGTGKTWIAIKKIRQEDSLGHKCLYTSYNPTLVSYVREVINRDSVVCQSIESLFKRELLEKELDDVRYDANGDALYYHLLQGKSISKYDCIIVDEAQDFTEDWAKSLCLFTKSESTLMVLYDENQNVYARDFGHGFGIEEAPYVLVNNIRNTKNIHDWIKTSTKVGEQIVSNDVCGCDPEVYDLHTVQQVEMSLNNILLQLVSEESVSPKSIVVLGNSLSQDSVWNNKKIGDYRLCNSISDEEHDIRYSSVSEFKGLESSIVIYINDWPVDIIKNKDYYYRLYIAGTRAKYYLYVLNCPAI